VLALKLPGIHWVLLRRWYVTICGLLAIVGICLLVSAQVPVSYEAKSYVLLLPPKDDTGLGGNPFLNLVDLGATADVLTRAMTDTNAVNSLAAKGIESDSYTVERDDSTAGPVLIVTSTESDAATALNHNILIVAQLSPTLNDIQQSVSVPQSSRVTALTIKAAQDSNAQYKSQIRALLVVVAVGAVITILVASLLDRLLMSRTRRAGRRRATNTDEDDDSDDSDDTDSSAAAEPLEDRPEDVDYGPMTDPLTDDDYFRAPATNPEQSRSFEPSATYR
jgi:hypothetical protein